MAKGKYNFRILEGMPDHAIKAFHEFYGEIHKNSKFLSENPSECIEAVNRISTSIGVSHFFNCLITELGRQNLSDEFIYNCIADIIFQSVYNSFEFDKTDGRAPIVIARQLDDAVQALEESSAKLRTAISPKLHGKGVNKTPSKEGADVISYISPDVIKILSLPVYLPIYAPGQTEDEECRRIGNLKTQVSIASLLNIIDAMAASMSDASKKFRSDGRSGVWLEKGPYAVFSLNNIFVNRGIDFSAQEYRRIKNALICELVNSALDSKEGTSRWISVEPVRDLIYRSKRRT